MNIESKRSPCFGTEWCIIRRLFPIRFSANPNNDPNNHHNRARARAGRRQARKDYREGVEGKTLTFASFALARLVAGSTIVCSAIAQRSGLFDALVSALRLRAAAAIGESAGGSTGRTRCVRMIRAVYLVSD